MNTNTTQRHIQPYKYVAMKTLDEVRIINPNNQSLRVSRAEIIAQLQKPDLDPHRRIMYEGALQSLQGN